MEVKEVIEFIKGIKHSGNGYGNSYISDFDKLKEVISLLQQGEKYKLMWEELQKEFGEEPIELHNLNEFMVDIKQKYFPERIVDEIVNGITEQIKEGAKVAKKEVSQDYPEGEE